MFSFLHHLPDVIIAGSFVDRGSFIDRDTWAEKSQAAMNRERQAMSIFHDRFLKQAREATSFPFTIENLIHPTLHLTDACWRDFKKEVIRHGCSVKRRAITTQEKTDFSRKARKAHNGNMYSISVTIKSNPEQAVDDMKQRVEKAEAAKKIKKEKAEFEAEQVRLKVLEDEKKEIEIKALVTKEYTQLEEEVLKVEGAQNICMNSKKRSSNNDEDPDLPLPTKILKVETTTAISKNHSTSTLQITAPIQRMLAEADNKYLQKVMKIKGNIWDEAMEEKKKMMDELDEKMIAEEDKRIQKAMDFRNTIKEKIEMVSASKSSFGKNFESTKKVEAASTLKQ